MKRLAIIHFNPIDKYPPAINLIRQLNDTGRFTINVFTTKWGTLNHEWYDDCANVKLIYVSKRKPAVSRVLRMLSYIYFLLYVILALIRLSPGKVLYYETISAGPALFFKWIKGAKVDLLIHYHEYNSLADYSSGMIWTKWLHQCESYFYRSAGWISHTNSKRMDLFLEEHKITRDPALHQIFPNYPPGSWTMELTPSKIANDPKLHLVYVGALSLDTMYVEEVAKVVAANPGQVDWDIYSENIDGKVVDYLKTLNASNIFYKGPIAYNEIPKMLTQYDIGLILYKATTFNFKFNAPNKLFEYLNCGLNVIFPSEMKGPEEYKTDLKPWVKAFENGVFLLPDLMDGKRLLGNHKARFTVETSALPIINYLNRPEKAS